MNFNRRFVLIALGTVAIATGMIFGSGAFTTVEADRTVNVEIADDATAFLGMEPVSDLAGTEGGLVVVNLDGTDTNATGINDDAVTTVDPVFNVTNNGGQEVTVGYNETATPEGIALDFEDATLDPGETSNVSITVAAGEPPREVNGGTIAAGDFDVTITADAN